MPRLGAYFWSKQQRETYGFGGLFESFSILLAQPYGVWTGTSLGKRQAYPGN